jgi:hypothetical protein
MRGRSARAPNASSPVSSTRVFARLVDANDAVPRLEVAVVARTFTGAYLALLDWWLQDEPERTATEVAHMALALLLNGFAWAMGLENKLVLDEGLALSPTLSA